MPFINTLIICLYILYIKYFKISHFLHLMIKSGTFCYIENSAMQYMELFQNIY